MRNCRKSFTPLEKASVFNRCRKKHFTAIRRRNFLTGFTYVELLMVITVLAVLVVMSFPRLSRNIKQSEFRTFSNKIYLLLDYSKNLAVLNSKSFKVLFDSEEREIEVVEANQEEDKSVKRIDILSGFTVSSVSEAVIFYPDGSSSEYNIQIKDQYGNEIELSS